MSGDTKFFQPPGRSPIGSQRNPPESMELSGLHCKLEPRSTRPFLYRLDFRMRIAHLFFLATSLGSVKLVGKKRLNTVPLTAFVGGFGFK